jgi:hypothetical protein
LGNNNWQKTLHSSVLQLNVRLQCSALQILYTRWGTNDLTMPPLVTKRKEIWHFFEGDWESHRSKEAYSLVTPNTRRITTFLFPLVEDVRSCCGYTELLRGCCWTLELLSWTSLGLLLLDPGVRCWIQRSSSPRDRSSHRWGSWGHCFLLTYLLLVKEKKTLFSSITKQKPPTPEFQRCTKDMYDQN